MGLLARIFKRQPKVELSDLEFVQPPVSEIVPAALEQIAETVEEQTDQQVLLAPLDESAPLAPEAPASAASAQTDSLLMGLTMGNTSAGPSLSARTVSAINGTESTQADDPRHYRDPIVDELIMKLMDEAHQRADAAVGAYERLGEQTSQDSSRWRRTARRALALTGTLALAIAVGGTWAGFTIGRQSTLVENLRQRVNENATVAAERDQLRAQLSDARTELFKNEIKLHETELAKVRAEAEAIIYQCRLQIAQQAPATQPAAGAKPQADNWATLLRQQ